MEQFLAALPFLACPIGMGAMMWFMSRHGDKPSGQSAADTEVAELRRELADLQAAQEASRERAAERA